MAKRHDLGKENYKLYISQNVHVWIREEFEDIICMEKPTSREGTIENQLTGEGGT